LSPHGNRVGPLDQWAATGTSTGRLMLAVPGGLADVERDLIRTRTAEGRSRAQKRWQHMCVCVDHRN
jgi:DNA invertase Pin-like site-specific DNA recombinase